MITHFKPKFLLKLQPQAVIAIQPALTPITPAPVINYYSLLQLQTMALNHLSKSMLENKLASKFNYMECWSEGMETIINAAGFTQQQFLNSIKHNKMTNTHQEFYREFNLFVKHAMADQNQTMQQLNFITELCEIVAEHRGDYNDNWDQWKDENFDSNGNYK